MKPDQEKESSNKIVSPPNFKKQKKTILTVGGKVYVIPMDVFNSINREMRTKLEVYIKLNNIQPLIDIGETEKEN